MILREMAEQVAVRLRRGPQGTTCVFIHVGYSRTEEKKSIQAQRRIDPRIKQASDGSWYWTCFARNIQWCGASGRNFLSGARGWRRLRYFHYSTITSRSKGRKIAKAVDTIHDEFGFTSLLKANSLLGSSHVRAQSTRRRAFGREG